MKQKLTALLLVLCMVMAFVPAMAVASAAENTGTTGATNPDVWDGTTFTQPTVGEGTEGKPYELSSAAQFMWFRNKREDDGAGAFYKLTADLDLNHVELGAPTQNTFAGVLDGNNKTIYNVSCAVAGLSPRGLLCISSGTIRNLTLDGVSMNSPSNNGDVTGGLVGQMTGGSIVNCNVLNAELHAKYYVGGLVGKVTGTSTIENCRTSTAEGKSLRTTVAFNTSFAVGGIVGQLDADAATYAAPITLTITGCTNDSRVGGDPTNMANAGGLVGFLTSTYEEKQVDGKYKDIENRLNLINCTNNADISSDNGDATKACAAGGLIGKSSRFKNILIENCVNRGTVNSASDAAGGFMGRTLDAGSPRNLNLTIKNSANYGNVTAAASFAGGFFGGSTVFPVTVTVTNSAQCGNVTAGTNAGGIIGNTLPPKKGSPMITLTGCYVNAQIKAEGETSYAGLLVGSGTTTIVAGSGNLLCGTAVADTAAGAYLGDGGVATKLTDTYLSGVAGLKLIANGAAATEETATDADFTGTTVLNALNAAAVTAGLPADTWVQGAKTPELKLFYVAPDAPAITIDGASLTIGENVTLNLFVKTETIRNAGVTVKTISIVNNDGDPAVNGVLRGTNYVFTIEGLSAKEFGTNKTYHVQYTTADAPGTPIDCTATKEYSPLQYAINMYGKTDKAGLDALLLSIVNYADAAAGTTTAKAAFDEKHADADWTAVTALTEIVKEDKDSGSYSYDAKTMPGIGARLTETIELTVYLKDTAYTGVTMKVGDTELTGTADEATQTVKFEGFWATDLYNEITLTFTGAEGTEPLEATTSLVQYLNRYAGNETYAKVATATAQYLYAARNFCLKNRTNA